MNAQTPTHTAAETALLEGFRKALPALPGNGDVRRSAMERIAVAGLPTRRSEPWHYTDLRRLLTRVPERSGAEVSALQPIIDGSLVLSVLGGEASSPSEKLDGVSFRPMSAGFDSGDIALPIGPNDPADVVGSLNTAFVTDGFEVKIADGASVQRPIELQALHGGGQAHSRFALTIGKRSKATICERRTGSGEGFVSSISSLDIQDGADLTYIIVQDQPVEATDFARWQASLGTDAKVTLFIMNTGGKLVRQEIGAKVIGENSDFQMRTVNLLAGSSHTDVTMVLDHLVPHTEGVEIVRNVVTGEAEGVFQGQIRVAKEAQKTDARMACNTLLLSEKADFSAKPELEIFADDVACGHGATVTEIDEDHLFYLMARGIPKADAERLLVKAFVFEIIEELENEELVGKLETRLDDWFASHGRAEG